jgi:hypothetical protein
MFPCLFGIQGWVETSGYCYDAAVPVMPRELIRTVGQSCHETDADQVRVDVVSNGLNDFITDHDLCIAGNCINALHLASKSVGTIADPKVSTRAEDLYS